MDRPDLMQRLYDREDSFTERKLESDNPREFRKTICAFANSLPEGRTGVLFIGVKDDGGVRGVDGVESLQKTIADICSNVCYPPIAPTPLFAVLEVEGRKVLAVEVLPSPKRPHFTGPAYVRVGSRSENASRELFEKMLTGHCEKSRTVQKLVGKPVTVELLGRTLDRREDPDHRAEVQCTLVSCTPHAVTLDLNGSRYSEPIDSFSLAEDVKYGRPYRLIFRGAVQNPVSREKQARLDAARRILHSLTSDEKEFIAWMLPLGEVPPSRFRYSGCPQEAVNGALLKGRQQNLIEDKLDRVFNVVSSRINPALADAVFEILSNP